MTRVDYRGLSPDVRRKQLDRLAEAFVAFKQEDEVKYFLQRLLTESEIVMLTRRLEIAEMLVGGLTYEQIKKKMKVSMTTIRSVDGWLSDAAYEYHLVREHQRRVIEADKKVKRIEEKRQRSNIVDELPDELRGLIRGDSRMILFRLILHDF